MDRNAAIAMQRRAVSSRFEDGDVMSADGSENAGSEDFIPDSDRSAETGHRKPVDEGFDSPKSIIRRKSTNRKKIN